MIVTTQLLVVFYTFFCDHSIFVLYFILYFFFFFLLLAMGSLSLFLCPGYWVGLHGSRPLLTLFVFVLFKYTILPCFGQKKKKGWLINRVLETRFPSGCHVIKTPHQTWSDHGNRFFETWFIGPKLSLLDLRC